ncbi:MAG: hypothetical protein Q8P67_00905, partial [archaeon]|nr:hypothetical protein [archaeon]
MIHQNNQSSWGELLSSLFNCWTRPSAPPLPMTTNDALHSLSSSSHMPSSATSHSSPRFPPPKTSAPLPTPQSIALTGAAAIIHPELSVPASPSRVTPPSNGFARSPSPHALSSSDQVLDFEWEEWAPEETSTETSTSSSTSTSTSTSSLSLSSPNSQASPSSRGAHDPNSIDWVRSVLASTALPPIPDPQPALTSPVSHVTTAESTPPPQQTISPVDSPVLDFQQSPPALESPPRSSQLLSFPSPPVSLPLLSGSSSTSPI